MALLTFCIIYSISRTVTIDLDSEKMTGYHLCEDDVEHILPKYKCKHCHLILRDPVQTPCAHFYCRGCFEHLKRDAVFKCKVDDIECNVAEIFPDGCVKKEIHSLTVHCLHIALGCEWEGKITDLEVSQSSVTRTGCTVKTNNKFITEMRVVRFFILIPLQLALISCQPKQVSLFLDRNLNCAYSTSLQLLTYYRLI